MTNAEYGTARYGTGQYADDVIRFAQVRATPNQGPSALFVEFDGSQSDGNGENILTYEWDFGDGTEATGVNAYHTYGTPGVYTVTLTVSTPTTTYQDTQGIEVLGSEVTTSYTPSGYFYDALRWSHRAFARVVLRTPDCETLNLPIVSGNVTIDRGGKTFRSADLEIAIESLGTTNRTALEKITVQSGEVELYSGITFEDNSTEEILVGRMRIDSLEIGDGATARIGAFDYALMLDEHPVTPADGTKIPAGTDWRVAIRRLIEDTFTWKPCGMDTMFVVDPAVKAWAIPEQAWDNVNRLTAILEWAESRNCWFYNLPDGRFYLTPRVENGPAVWTVNSGDDGVLVKATQRFSREAQYNGISISFDTPEGEYESIRGFIIDNEPGSTTRWGGPFGKRVLDLSGIPAANAAEAEAIAYRKLEENRGATKSLSLTTVRNPALVPGQVIRVIHPMIDNELHVIERVTHQLGGATSDIDCKLSRQ